MSQTAKSQWWDDFEKQVPSGGYTGGMDTSPVSDPSVSPNPFGGDQEATTRAQLEEFRAAARAQGLRVDEGDEIAYQQMRAGLGSLGSADGGNGAVQMSSTMPGAITPYGKTFTPPTAEGANTDGYKFTVAEALRALDTRKAAQGKLRAGVGRDYANLTTGLANAQYGDRFNQALQEFDANLGAYYAGADRAFSSGMGIRQQGRSELDADRGYGLAQQQYGLQRDQFGRLLDRDLVGDQFALAELGGPVREAGVRGGYTGDIADLYTQQGNAQAAGTVGSGNAWSNALGGVVPLAQSYVLSRALRPAA